MDTFHRDLTNAPLIYAPSPAPDPILGDSSTEHPPIVGIRGMAPGQLKDRLPVPSPLRVSEVRSRDVHG